MLYSKWWLSFNVIKACLWWTGLLVGVVWPGLDGRVVFEDSAIATYLDSYSGDWTGRTLLISDLKISLEPLWLRDPDRDDSIHLL